MSDILPSRIVFIDTCIFRNLNFHLNNESFSSFSRLCREGELDFVTTQITQKEIQKRVHEHEVEAFAGLQKFRDRTHLLSRLHCQFGKSYQGLTVEILEEHLNKAVKSWFVRTKAKTIPIPRDATNKVLEKYFNQEKPFSEGKKKSEFPDAFVIQALLSLKKKLFVVSAHGDFSVTNKGIIHLKSLSELLHLYNSHIDIVAEYVKKLVMQNRAKLLASIQSELERIPAKLANSDGEIKFGELHVLDIIDAWVVSFKRGSAEVSLEFKFDISGRAMELDEAGFIADMPNYQEEQVSQAQVKVFFDLQNDSRFHFEKLRLNKDLEAGIQIG